MRQARLILLILATVSPCHLVTASSLQASNLEADPNKVYEVTPEVGTWMICVTSYTGPQALQLARELVLEIRQRDQLHAWVYDRGEEERRKHREERERLQEMYPHADLSRIRTTRIQDQCAVLIGGYRDIETARGELEKVKRLSPPRSEKLMPLLTQIDPKGGAGKQAAVRDAHMNPFPGSFVTWNPTVPREPRQQQPDAFLKQLNADEPYSLLKCRQPWTLVVKTFEGASVIQSREAPSGGFLEKLRSAFSGSGDVLTASAMQAREVAKVLRTMKFDAYVLHTRTQSLVCIGGYASASDPNLFEMQRKVANLQLGPVKLFANPVPREVPRL